MSCPACEKAGPDLEWRLLPENLVFISRRKGETDGWGRSTVERVRILPPVLKADAEKQGHGPILASLYSVQATNKYGDTRYYGAQYAHIGPDLRVHLTINPRDEVMWAWDLPD